MAMEGLPRQSMSSGEWALGHSPSLLEFRRRSRWLPAPPSPLRPRRPGWVLTPASGLPPDIVSSHYAPGRAGAGHPLLRAALTWDYRAWRASDAWLPQVAPP